MKLINASQVSITSTLQCNFFFFLFLIFVFLLCIIDKNKFKKEGESLETVETKDTEGENGSVES